MLRLELLSLPSLLFPPICQGILRTACSSFCLARYEKRPFGFERLGKRGDGEQERGRRGRRKKKSQGTDAYSHHHHTGILKMKMLQRNVRLTLFRHRSPFKEAQRKNSVAEKAASCISVHLAIGGRELRCRFQAKRAMIISKSLIHRMHSVRSTSPLHPSPGEPDVKLWSP